MENKQSILYVDDEAINLSLFSMLFRKDYNVFTAKNGYKGLDVLDEHPDVEAVISDMKMPELNGIEFIRKARDKFPDKKYFILTGFAINDEIQEALNEGLILKYFQKPFNKQTILNSLQVT